jgi:DNA-binding response OmpR family regulator
LIIGISIADNRNMGSQSKRFKILIVDDDSAARSGLKELLEWAGYETVVAGTFQDGVQALRTLKPDLLLADVRLGEFNGLQLIATNPRTTPAIVVTAFDDSVLQVEARRLGAEYLVKPVTPAKLLQLIEQKLHARASGASFNPIRRWTRKLVNRPVDVWIEDAPARILDVSYGGLRFEIERTAECEPPRSFNFSVSEGDLSVRSVHADLVWMTRAGERNWVCGAAVSEPDQPVVRAWYGLVDAIG